MRQVDFISVKSRTVIQSSIKIYKRGKVEMLIYFKKDEIVINTENVSSIEYATNNYDPCLRFVVNGVGKDIDMIFSTKEEAFKVLDIILTAYNTQQKLLVI